MKSLWRKIKNKMETIEIPTTKKIKISKEDFEEYESCRQSGLTNIFDLTNVEMITGLSKDKIKAIIQEYTELNEKFTKETSQ